MAEYDLGSLSPPEFEQLMGDLLQAEMGTRFELFKSGKDGGIDLRNCLKNENIIVQCKHFFNSSTDKLISALEKEREKVQRLNPSRYIIAKSCGLTPGNKNKIQSIFSPYCLSGNDIYGRDDILKLLKDNEKIVRKNFKLWFTSEVVLRKILHSDIINQTEIDLKNFRDSVPKLVVTDSYQRVQKILDVTNTCIICGQPGIGKSTLMRLFVLAYVAEGYEPVKISKDVREAYRLFDNDEKQIFYYDDFLGQIFLENLLEKNEDTEICSFILRITKMPNKKILLATREHVFNQALDRYEKLREIKKYESTIILADFSTNVKAQILYNHIWHSKITDKNIQEILMDKNYLKIINHQHFNPRIIEWMTLDDATKSDNYLERFLDSLNHPERIWEFAFNNEISESSRIILLILVSYHSYFGIEKNRLLKAFERAVGKDGKITDISNEKEFEKSLHELDGTFLNSKCFSNGAIYLEFSNPSIREFIQITLLNSNTYLTLILDSGISAEQANCIWTMVENSKDGKRYLRNLNLTRYLEIVNNLLELNRSKTYPYSNYEELVALLIRIATFTQTRVIIQATDKALVGLNERIIQNITHLHALRYIFQTIKQKQTTNFEKIGEVRSSIIRYLLSKKPSSLDECQQIIEFLSDTDIQFESTDLENLKKQAIHILDKGLIIEESAEEDYNIYTYDADGNYFSKHGSGIKELEEVFEQMKEISDFFNYSMNEDITSEIEEKIDDYYISLLEDQEPEKSDEILSSTDQTELSIDDLFNSLTER